MARLLHDHIHVELIYKWNREQPTQKQSTCVYMKLYFICGEYKYMFAVYANHEQLHFRFLRPLIPFFCRSFIVLLFKHSVDTQAGGNKGLLLIYFCLCDCQ